MIHEKKDMKDPAEEPALPKPLRPPHPGPPKRGQFTDVAQPCPALHT